MEEDQEHTYRVVRFEVIPQSIRLEGEWGGLTRGAGLDGPGLPFRIFSYFSPNWLIGSSVASGPSHRGITIFSIKKLGSKRHLPSPVSWTRHFTDEEPEVQRD